MILSFTMVLYKVLFSNAPKLYEKFMNQIQCKKFLFLDFGNFTDPNLMKSKLELQGENRTILSKRIEGS
jgi:hypothetical protein